MKIVSAQGWTSIGRGPLWVKRKCLGSRATSVLPSAADIVGPALYALGAETRM